MPIYEYECPIHGNKEVYLSLEEYDKDIYCYCKTKMRKVLSANIKRDEPTWIGSVNETINDGFRDKISTRTEMRRVLKEKGLSQIG